VEGQGSVAIAEVYIRLEGHDGGPAPHQALQRGGVHFFAARRRPMTMQINAIRMSGGTQHEYISYLAWNRIDNDQNGVSTRQQMVDWLRQSDNRAIVKDKLGCVDIGVVNATPPYVRTHADGRWTDNLLSLPRF
jgi:hypothetical protein